MIADSQSQTGKRGTSQCRRPRYPVNHQNSVFRICEPNLEIRLHSNFKIRYSDFRNSVYFRPICDSRIQRLQKNVPMTFSHIMATNTYLKSRQHAESIGGTCVHKKTEEKHANNKNPPSIHCKNIIPLVEFEVFWLVAPHTAVLW